MSPVRDFVADPPGQYERELMKPWHVPGEYTPSRIQRKRTKGWRMPDGAVYVGRPSVWGNQWAHGRLATRVALFREEAVEHAAHDPEWLAPLRGRDLACWCPLDQPCHADVLLEFANAPEAAAR